MRRLCAPMASTKRMAPSPWALAGGAGGGGGGGDDVRGLFERLASSLSYGDVGALAELATLRGCFDMGICDNKCMGCSSCAGPPPAPSAPWLRYGHGVSAVSQETASPPLSPPAQHFELDSGELKDAEASFFGPASGHAATTSAGDAPDIGGHATPSVAGHVLAASGHAARSLSCEVVVTRGTSLRERRRLSLDVAPLAAAQIAPLVANWGDGDGRYELLETLGRGSTSSVRRAVRRSDGLVVALKTTHTGLDDMVPVARREFELLKRVSHPNIVRVLDFVAGDGQASMVMDFLACRGLDKVVPAAPGRRLEEARARLLGMQLLGAVEYLHGQGIHHRDLKPENAMISHDLKTLTLVDFNSACESAAASEDFPPSTLLYAAPEVVLRGACTYAGDVWAVALSIFWMLSGRLPQGREREGFSMIEFEVVATGEVGFAGKRWATISRAAKLFLERCLALDAASRPTAQNAMLDAWLSDALLETAGREERLETAARAERQSGAAAAEDAEARRGQTRPLPHQDVHVPPHERHL